MPPASDQFIDVVPEFYVEWRRAAAGGPIFRSKVLGSSVTTISNLKPDTRYKIRVQVNLNLGS